jgi:hypothetical protein
MFRFLAALGVALTLFAGCASVTRMPRVDLTDADWTVWSGQAVWRPRADRPSLAGDLIVARNARGDVLINFSKSPLSIFTAQTSGGSWKIDFIESEQSHAGQGRPPKRFVWFYLPGILDGAAPPGDWSAESLAADEWTLVSPKTGETIKLVLDP